MSFFTLCGGNEYLISSICSTLKINVVIVHVCGEHISLEQKS